VTYQCQYFTISSSISECDHKCETRNAEPEIGPDRSSQTQRNPQVDGYRSGFGPPRVSESGYWPGLEPNRPVFRSKPGPLAGYPDPLLILDSGDSSGDGSNDSDGYNWGHERVHSMRNIPHSVNDSHTH